MPSRRDDDTIKAGQAIPAGADVQVATGSHGIVATVRLDGPSPPSRANYGPTRYQLALRRQAANRTRRAASRQQLPELRAGDCDRCGGWGVVSSHRLRCDACGGTGDR